MSVRAIESAPSAPSAPSHLSWSAILPIAHVGNDIHSILVADWLAFVRHMF